MQNTKPLISFTFDDFPDSALSIGGAILREHGVVGTYYVSLGLLGRDAPTGHICTPEHVAEVIAQGHELGCHTFDHDDAWETDSRRFEESLLANEQALRRLLPHTRFATMSYPISTPRPDIKRRAERRFDACRGGGQSVNTGSVDLNYLRAFFLEQARDSPDSIWEMIDRNTIERGWLIFATHDVSAQPTRFGCTPDFFKRVVGTAKASGARILPVAKALALVSGRT